MQRRKTRISHREHRGHRDSRGRSTDRGIIAAAIEVHKTLGSGLLESIYEEALCIELDLMGLEFQRQLVVDVLYKGHAIQGQRLDLVIENEVVVEIKSLRVLHEVATAQLL